MYRRSILSGAVLGGAGILLFQLAFADSTGTLLPISDGAYQQWTPKTGSAHYQMVDESSCNGTTDYNSTNTVGNRDSYGIGMATIPNGATITAIEVTPCASKNKSGGGPSTLNVFYRFNGVNSADAGGYALSGVTPVNLTATTFSGLSLAKESWSSLQVGAVLSAGTKGARLSRIAVRISYLPAPTNLTGTLSGSDVLLNWTDNAAAEDGYSVERNANGSGWVEIATTTANVITYTDAGLSPGTYSHRVRAFDSTGSSAYSNTATTTIP